MKKSFILLISILILTIVGCSNQPQKQPQKEDINTLAAIELESIDNNYSDETLKALSVILRTNLTINNRFSTNNKTPNEKYLKITNQTQDELLKNDNGDLIEISLEENNNYHWQKSIKKSKILEFAFKHNINLSNISKIEPVFENEKVIGLNIGNKFFDYKLLISEFDLISNEIESIETTKSEIIIKGKNKGFIDNFDTNKSEQLSNDNYDYKNILKIFFKDLKID